MTTHVFLPFGCGLAAGQPPPLRPRWGGFPPGRQEAAHMRQAAPPGNRAQTGQPERERRPMSGTCSFQIDVKTMLAAFQALEQATDHHPVPAQMLQHPVGVARIDRRHVRPDLVEDRQQIVARVAEEGRAVRNGSTRPIAARRSSPGALADLQQQLTGDGRRRIGRIRGYPSISLQPVNSPS